MLFDHGLAGGAIVLAEPGSLMSNGTRGCGRPAGQLKSATRGTWQCSLHSGQLQSLQPKQSPFLLRLLHAAGLAAGRREIVSAVHTSNDILASCQGRPHFRTYTCSKYLQWLAVKDRPLGAANPAGRWQSPSGSTCRSSAKAAKMLNQNVMTCILHAFGYEPVCVQV